tara:strand:+ start:16 stop:195 length:180 start_codon:yes stop_codon:yes gene_type:complete
MSDLQPLMMVHTPESWDELMDWINLHNKDERTHLVVASGMGYNLAINLSIELNKESNNG